MAVIDEAWCIGCTLCMEACPTDAILGANKRMHTVIAAHCTGCDLCLPVCPVDCIEMVSVSDGRTGWDAWSPQLAQHARTRYEFRTQRLARREQDRAKRHIDEAQEKLTAMDELTHGVGPEDPGAEQEATRKRAIIEAAIARARQQLSQ